MTPTVVGDKVYAGSCSGVFYALDTGSGQVAWSYDTRIDSGPAQFHGDPLAIGGMIVTGSDTAEPSYAYAFDLETGGVIWLRESDAPETDIVAVGDLLVGQTLSGDLVALDPGSGDRAWKVGGDGARCSGRVHSASVHERTVYFSDKEGRLNAVSGDGGKVLWQVDLGCAAGAPRFWNGHVYLGLEADVVVRVSAADGSLVSEHQTEGRPHSRLTPTGGAIVALVGEQQLVALYEELDRVLWQRSTETEWTSYQPLMWDGSLIVGDAAGNLLALDPASGSTLWSHKLQGMIRGLGASGDTLYVGTLKGNLYAVRPPAVDGE